MLTSEHNRQCNSKLPPDEVPHANTHTHTHTHTQTAVTT